MYSIYIYIIIFIFFRNLIQTLDHRPRHWLSSLAAWQSSSRSEATLPPRPVGRHAPNRLKGVTTWWPSWGPTLKGHGKTGAKTMEHVVFTVKNGDST